MRQKLMEEVRQQKRGKELWSKKRQPRMIEKQERGQGRSRVWVNKKSVESIKDKSKQKKEWLKIYQRYEEHEENSIRSLNKWPSNLKQLWGETFVSLQKKAKIYNLNFGNKQKENIGKKMSATYRKSIVNNKISMNCRPIAHAFHLPDMSQSAINIQLNPQEEIIKSNSFTPRFKRTDFFKPKQEVLRNYHHRFQALDKKQSSKARNSHLPETTHIEDLIAFKYHLLQLQRNQYYNNLPKININTIENQNQFSKLYNPVSISKRIKAPISQSQLKEEFHPWEHKSEIETINNNSIDI